MQINCEKKLLISGCPNPVVEDGDVLASVTIEGQNFPLILTFLIPFPSVILTLFFSSHHPESCHCLVLYHLQTLPFVVTVASQQWPE
jgi:hypothetical protein